MRAGVMHGSNVVIGIADGVNKFVEYAFILIDLFLANIALRN